MLLLACAGLGVAEARAACDSPAPGISLDCSQAGVTAMRIEGEVPVEAGPLSVFADQLLTVTNAGVLDLGAFAGLDPYPVGDRLLLMAARLDYLGAGASMESRDGYAISAFSTGEGSSRFELNDHFAGTGGLSVNATTGDVEIDLRSGEIDVTHTGIFAAAAEGDVRLRIGEGTWLRGLVPVQLAGPATRLELAGELRNEEGISLLGEGSSVLELQPGFALEGRINAQQGSNTLIWGGSGGAGFDLSEIGDKYFNFQTFEKRGSASWTLTGAAADPLGITVWEGELLLAGALDAGDLTTVKQGARLGGDGQFGNIDVWGTLAPGLDMGTLYGGEVVFQQGSLLEIEIGAAGGDRLELASADLRGATLAIVPRGVPDALLSPYVFLQTGTELGTDNRFLSVSSASTRYLAELDYGATSVAVRLTPTGKSFAEFARTAAERAVAERLDALGSAAPLFPALDQMTDAEIEDMLAQLAGEDLAATPALLGEPGEVLGSAALGRVQQAGSVLPSAAPLGYAPLGETVFDPRPVSVWGRVVTQLEDRQSSRSGTTMVLAGLDSLVEEDWSVGGLLGFGGSAMSGEATRSQSASLSAAVYGARPLGPLTLRVVAAGTVSAVQSRREVSGPGVDETYVASYPALGLQLLAELAAPLQLGPVSAELFGDLGFSGVQTGGYTETGGSAALTVAPGWSEALDLAAGLRMSRAMAFGTLLARLDGFLALTHRFADPAVTQHSFASSPPFAVTAPGQSGTGLLAGIDLRLDIERTGLVELGYGLSLRQGASAHTLSARFVRPL